ncbi:uncharacterized protein BT62DRAFT_941926 [Guyanagaster necrorhizus]|uniref:Cytoplasmic tRNA 2-thiolation protein 2 n=1 Tax=Guyanagaster necrorhizus TaxID=856835 RepID=A0A9P7W209_9AGAR|nr:uncharacterized protein BT62DRAFT_941926 [Guyanagaster necrorhizus MCA 3950]KAG7451187.1 hypothetical protein BT62DRAFT_941926 [Guyanagaster necrorhizus MCA 3950]
MSACGNPATETDVLMERRPKFDKSRDCVKCKTNRGNIVIRHAVYCKECFTPLVSFKFRRSLEPFVNELPQGPRRKALKASGDLLLAFSGGLGSTVLLDLAYQAYFANRHEEDRTENQQGGKDHPRNAPIWPKGSICYVEICSAFPGMKDRTEKIRTAIASYGSLDFIPLRLEDAFDNSWWESVGGRPSPSDLEVDLSNEEIFISFFSKETIVDPVTSLRTFLSNLPTHTAISRAVPTLVRILLLYTARSTGSSHLLLGTSLTSLSVSLISAISQGAGFTVREEAQEEWASLDVPSPTRKSVRVIRPLRDIGMKECAILCWWRNLNVIGKEKIPGGKEDIANLTKDFIVGLEKDYPSTVSTIARTCGKLIPKAGSARKCILCEQPVQQGIQDWKSRTSIRTLDAAETTSDVIEHSRFISPYLCYACHTTFTSRSSRGSMQSGTTSVRLPVWTGQHLMDAQWEGTNGDGGHEQKNEVWEKRRAKEEDMKNIIGDFLLGDTST